MPKQIIIAEQHRIGAVFGEDQIQELVVATGQHQVSDIYLGIVENVLPGIDAAFINIGDPSRNGFIHVSDLGPLRLKRSSGSITELVAPQQKVLVQIMKEPTGNKGPRLTGNVSLPGRYVVLIPFGKGVNLSRRIRSEGERNRLRALAVLSKPAGMGLLVRTEAEGKTEDAILEDLEMLQKQWEIVQQDANSTRAPALLNRDDDFIQKVLRDMYADDVNRIVVDSEQGLKRVKQTLMTWDGGQLPQGVPIDRHRERQPILEYFRIDAAIREALKPRVDLPSGGYIIIEPTEALTVVDVNSGSFTRSNTSRETVLWTNCEAATEIARQLRLRNIAGVIIIDFIDMDYRKDQLQVLEHFNKQLRVDKAHPQIAQLSELGLVELTRKRQGQNIYELFGETCATCGGLGHLAHVPGQAIYGANGEAVAVSLVSSTPQREHRSRTHADGTAERRSLSRSTTPRRAERNVVESRQPATGIWEGFDAEGVESDQSLDLVNHPSYQEQNGTNKKRRRRLGRTDSDEIVRAVPRPTPPGEVVARGRSVAPPEPRNLNREPAPPNVSATVRPIPAASINDPMRPDLGRNFVPTQIEAHVSEPIVVSFAEEPEEDRTPKPQRVKPTRPTIEPPEIVAVEMSELEKETYAWMGVSPMVKLGRELKNPKTAIVSVVPLGTLSPEELLPPMEKIAEVEIVTVESAPEVTLEAEQIELPMEIEATEFAPPVSAEVLIPVVTEDVESAEVVEIVMEVSIPEEESEELAANRRRKRRSSAVVD
jgi:ribonuclease E